VSLRDRAQYSVPARPAVLGPESQGRHSAFDSAMLRGARASDATATSSEASMLSAHLKDTQRCVLAEAHARRAGVLPYMSS
jgi:hypothetical protein